MKFIALGDVGSFTIKLENMMKMAKISKNDVLLMIGDNFYPYLKSGEQVKRFKKVFSKFSKERIFAVLGNHDYDGDIGKEVDGKWWTFPYFYYYRYINGIGFWFIDTQILDPDDSWFNLSGEIDEKIGDYKIERAIHLDWLKDSLEKHKDIKHKVFVGHYPLVSGGSYPTNKKLISQLCPLMKKYKVRSFISGHDHTLQHLKYKYRGFEIDQFVTGSSGSSYPEGNKKGGKLLYFSEDIGYLCMSKCKDELKFTFENGKDVMYKV